MLDAFPLCVQAAGEELAAAPLQQVGVEQLLGGSVGLKCTHASHWLQCMTGRKHSSQQVDLHAVAILLLQEQREQQGQQAAAAAATPQPLGPQAQQQPAAHSEAPPGGGQEVQPPGAPLGRAGQVQLPAAPPSPAAELGQPRAAALEAAHASGSWDIGAAIAQAEASLAKVMRPSSTNRAAALAATASSVPPDSCFHGPKMPRIVTYSDMPGQASSEGVWVV